jgi:trans-2,3-dihydro-3-hydroxyanthranilate isomerase
MGLHFSLVDVFSDQPFGGNQLAVFPDAAGIADQTMQQLAREFNFSETTFVLPPSDPSFTHRVRIFTPRRELPFAGHPTVGTAAVLASLSDDGAAEQRFVFEEGIGPVTVAVDGPAIWFRLRRPQYETTGETPPAAAIAKALTLPEDAIIESWYGGVGLRFCFVRLAGRELVDRAVLDKAAWAREIAGNWSSHLYFFTADDKGDDQGTDVYARFFAPDVGVEEDPATGSACASLAASLAHRSAEQDGTYRLQIAQGVAMGRPSTLEGTAHKKAGQITEVAVGGRAAIVGNGTMTLSARPG